eukprot:SAG11_NODE_759_length_7305_cov_2.494865_9_plen_133_part_00
MGCFLPSALTVLTFAPSGPGERVRWCAPPKTAAPSFRWTKRAAGTLGWSVVAVSCPLGREEPEPLKLEVNGTLEFDGFMDFKIALECGATRGQHFVLSALQLNVTRGQHCVLSALQLNVTSRSATRNVMGLF